jgi:hypothetical protein
MAGIHHAQSILQEPPLLCELTPCVRSVGAYL